MKKNRRKYFTRHGFDRTLERMQISEKELQTLSMYALKNGLDFEDLPRGNLKSFVYRKKSKKHKRVKLYRGYVFIFFVCSTRLITCYPIPEFYKREYEEILREREVKKK